MYVYSNPSLASIGESQDALAYKVKDYCGAPPNQFGEFYYPGGVQVPLQKLGHASILLYKGPRGQQEIAKSRVHLCKWSVSLLDP